MLMTNLMKRVNFLNYLYVLLILVLGLNLTSCKDDDDLGGNDDPTPPTEEKSEAGDDFYMYVNADWHNSLAEGTNSTGYLYDVAKACNLKTNHILEQMEEYRLLKSSLNKLINGNEEENIAYADAIIEEIGNRMEMASTPREVGNIIGECIVNGYIDNVFRLYIIPANDNDKSCFSLAPDPILYKLINHDEDADNKEYASAILPNKHLNFSNYKKYFSNSRANNNNMVSYIIEGTGLDPEYFTIADENAELFEMLNHVSVEELVEAVMDALVAELYLYCGDAKTMEISNGTIKTTKEVFDAMLKDLLAYPISYYFCEEYVNDNIKAEYTEYAESLREVFAKRIQANNWLSASTKQQALNKLNNMKFYIGEPNEWYTESFPKFKGQLLLEDILEAKQSRNRTIISLIGTNKQDAAVHIVILTIGGIPLYEYNSCYVAETNTMQMFPTFMIEPEYTSDMETAHKYAVFYVIGHEMTHGFDKIGSEYDANGNKNDWWTPTDKQKFIALNNALAKQISTWQVAPGIYADGNRTVTEDVADLGGLNIAFDALTQLLTEQGVTGEDLKQCQKDFFEYHAYRHRIVYGSDYFNKMLKDIHSFNMIRVNGMVQHMDSWYDLYNITSNNTMYIAPDKRVTIW